jgi:RNA polymerase sigma-70 factor, ECF subfamily
MLGLRDSGLAAIEELYRRRFQRFLQVATAIAGDRDRALEAVQDAFADAIRSRRTFRGEGPLEAWVWRAVTNRALKARRPVTQALPEDLPAVNGRRLEERDELARLVGLLPERQRLAVFLRYYADLDYRSIAQALDVEIGTVSATLAAAHQTLRKSLKGVRP